MALIIGIIISSVVACFMFKASPKRAVKDAAHTMDHISWAALLPQILATLGVVFVSTGMGDQVSKLLSSYISLDNAFIAVAAYCIAMALFTIVMGNAFAVSCDYCCYCFADFDHTNACKSCYYRSDWNA